MSAILPKSRKSSSAAKRFGKLNFLLVAASLCVCIALFAATGIPHKVKNAAMGNLPAKSARLAGHKRLTNERSWGVPVYVDYGSASISFAVGVPVSLTPTGSGADAPSPGVYGSPQVLGSGLTFSQNGVALDTAGNMYVNDANTGSVEKITADGSSTSIIGSGFSTQSGNAAVDKAGNVYVTDQALVWKIPAGATPGTYDAPVVINNTITRPYGIALDTVGNIYVTGLGAGVYKMANDGSGKVKIDNAVANAAGIAVDASGNVYVCDYVTLSLYEIPAAGGTEVLLANGFSLPETLAVDGMGNIYVGDRSVGIYEVAPGGGTPVALISGLSNNVGLAIDASYNLYVSLQGSTGVNKFSPVGGYFISQPLPAGLSFNSATGAITGTPTAIAAKQKYTISAYNSDGGTSTTVCLQVIAAPAISYTNPNVGTIGVSIDPIIPTASNVDTPGYAPYRLFANNFSMPGGIASDAAGNIYVADKGNNQVMKVPADGSPAVSVGSGFSGPSGVAVDAAGNIYVADTDNGEVKKMSPDGLTINSIGSGFSAPVGVAVDGDGNVYVADRDNEAAYKILATNGSVVTLSTDFDAPSGIAVDITGQNIYVSDASANSVFKISSTGCGCSDDIGYFFNSPTAVTLDPKGDLFVTDVDVLGGGPGFVYKVDSRGCNRVDVGSAFIAPYGVAVDPSGILFVTDAAVGALFKISPSGGYYLATTLPKGLKFNDTTGVISGKGKAASAAADYKVVAYNPGGGVAALVNIAIVAPPPPTLSYTNPNVDTVGFRITPITPTANSVGAPGYMPYKSFATGFSNPAGTATDAAGNIYVADHDNNQIMKVPANGSAAASIGSGFSGPSGVTVDAAGNIYVADTDNGEVKKMSADGLTITGVGSGFSAPVGVAVDAAGNVYVADAGNAAVYKVLATDGSVHMLSDDFDTLSGIAVDATGKNIYVSDSGAQSVYKIDPNGSGCGCGDQDLGYSFLKPTAVALDPQGNLYITDGDIFNGPGLIFKVDSRGCNIVDVGSTFLSPNGITVDPSGNLFVTEKTAGVLYEVTPSGGYFLATALPKGLKMNDTTGVITGKPTAQSPAADYKVIAYNLGGSTPALVNIEVDLPPVPALSYTTPNIYTAGVQITPLQPVSTFVGNADHAATPVTIGTGFNAPRSTAVDKAGNVFVADSLNNRVMRIPADGGSPTPWGYGFSGPTGVAVDSLGFVYVADYGNQLIKMISQNGVMITQLASVATPTAVAVDSARNVYYTDRSTASVYKVSASGGSVDTLSMAFPLVDPIGIAVSGKDVYVSDSFYGAVLRITTGVYIPDLIGPFNYPAGIAIDAGGNLYVSDEGDSTIYRVSAKGINPVALSTTGLSGPEGLSVDGKGNLYIADVNNNLVAKVAPTGAYFIDKALPSGLSFSYKTGSISGTPIVGSAARDYTVSAYNAGGGASVVVNIAVGLPPLPTLSYPGPNAYTLGVAIPALTPSLSNTSPVSYIGTPVTVSSGYGLISGAATDRAGNVYVTDFAANAVFKLQPGGLGTPQSIGSGFSEPQNVAVDTAGNVYVADSGNGAIVKIPHGTGTPVTIASGFDYPVGVAVNAAGDVYFTDSGSGGNGAVYKLTGGTGSPITVTTDLLDPEGVAVDDQGNVFILDTDTEALYEMAGGIGTLTRIGPWLNGGGAVTVDNTGNVYVSDSPLGVVYIIPIAGGPARTVSGLYDPLGIAVDSSGNLFATNPGFDPSENELKIIAPSGGLFISPALPAGFSFDSTTGSITGTPIKQSPATDYTVTAFNLGGSASTTVSIKVKSNVSTLAALSTSVRPVSPVFKPGVATYTTAPIPYSAASTKITATPTDAGATVQVRINGGSYAPVTNGTPSDDLALNTGTNTIDVLVTSEDGLITSTYTITMVRPGSALLNTLTYSPSVIKTKVTGSNYADYTATVSAAQNTISVIPVAQDPNATITVNGQPVASGATSDPITLAAGTTTINTVVTASAGGASNTYSIVITRPADALLTSLTYDPSLTVVKVPGTHDFDYTATVYKALSSIKVHPVTEDPAATVTVNGQPVTSGGASDPISLVAGPNVITTVVTAGDGVTTKTYSITITRAPNALLATLTFDPNITKVKVAGSNYADYTATVKSTQSSITVTPVTQDPTSTVTVNGQPVSSGGTSNPIALIVGTTTINTVVTASDGTTSNTYSVVITRQADALLTSLTYDPSLTVVKVAGTHDFDYTATVYKVLSSIQVHPVTEDPSATVTVNGQPVTSGGASDPVSLVVGPNVINTVVTAADGVTTKTYSITITRAPNALLATLSFNPNLTKTKVAGSNYVDYAATVSPLQTSITVTPVTQDPTSTVTVNGQPVTSGATSDPIALSVGANTINTVVTASDGTTSNTYSIVVTRPADALLTSLTYDPALTVSKVTGPHDFDYTAKVYKNNTIKVIPVAEDPSATITVNGNPVASGAASADIPLSIGPNVINTVVTAIDGTTTKTYSITITRMPNALLATLTYSPAISKTKVTGGNYVDYVSKVPNFMTSVSVTPVTQDPSSTVKVNGQTVASGATSAPITLNVGDNTINTVVTAEDGTTSNTYAIVITRQSSLGLRMLYEPTTEYPVGTALVVHQNVSPNGDGTGDVFKIDGITNYPDNKLQIMNRSGELIYEAKGYDNATNVFDGHASNGKLQQAGTYLYSLEYKVGNETKRKTGYFVLKY